MNWIKHHFYKKKTPLLLIIVFFWSCTSEQRKNLESTPLAIGKTNEIVVVADKNVWEGPIGDSLRYYFESPYLILPQPEPIFDLRHFTIDDLNAKPLRRQLRTYLFLGDIEDEHSSVGKMIKEDLRSENIRRAKEDPEFTSTAGRNKWAQGQLLIYLFGFGEQALLENIRKNYPVISRKVSNFDKSKIDDSTYAMGSNKGASETVKNELGFEIKLPNEYMIAIHDGDFMWLRRETKGVSSNIMLYKVPYKDKSQLSKAGIKKVRNELGKYITTDVEGAYMRINDVDLPMFCENKTINTAFALESHGIWEIEKDYMGGPFVNYAVLNSKTNELIIADGFIHAPGKDKRDHMQYLEHIFSSIKF